MATLLSHAMDQALDISDAYLVLGAADDRAASSEGTALLNNDHALQSSPAAALAMYNRSLEAHDYAVTLGNWLNTIGGRYRPAELRSRASVVSSSPEQLERQMEALRASLRVAASARRDWPTLSFLRLAEHSTLHDPAPERPPSARQLARLPDYRRCVGFPARPAARPPLCAGEGSPLPPMAGAVAAAARELVHATFQSSRTCFAFAQLLDRSSLKGFEQWFSWRARSDVANAVTMAHYLSARGAVVTAPRAAHDASAVRALEARRMQAGSDQGLAVDGGLAMQLAQEQEQRKAAAIGALYSAAAANQTDDACTGAADPGVCAWLMYPGLRWLRAGDSEDEPEWRESLLLSQARKLEDMRKIRTILSMARAQSRHGVNGFGDYYVDHQLPDTVP